MLCGAHLILGNWAGEPVSPGTPETSTPERQRGRVFPRAACPDGPARTAELLCRWPRAGLWPAGSHPLWRPQDRHCASVPSMPSRSPLKAPRGRLFCVGQSRGHVLRGPPASTAQEPKLPGEQRKAQKDTAETWRSPEDVSAGDGRREPALGALGAKRMSFRAVSGFCGLEGAADLHV